jgi:hypothetical protein
MTFNNDFFHFIDCPTFLPRFLRRLDAKAVPIFRLVFELHEMEENVDGSSCLCSKHATQAFAGSTFVLFALFDALFVFCCAQREPLEPSDDRAFAARIALALHPDCHRVMSASHFQPPEQSLHSSSSSGTGDAAIDMLAKVTHVFPRGTFRVDARFVPNRIIGLGAYGVVCMAQDRLTGKMVAIKKILDVTRDPVIARRTLREIKLLRHFHGHENILTITTVLQPEPGCSDIYVVSDLLSCDLHRIIHSQQALTEEHIRYFMYQLLRGLKYLHSANVIHRDIKPSNLLVTGDCDLRICDFGMARGVSNSNNTDATAFMTAYVATRWYRAPEVLLCLREYTTAVDMWSVGCVFGEMLARKHVFPGAHYVDQLNCIFNLLGTPSTEYCTRAGSDLAVKYLLKLPKLDKIPFKSVFPNASYVGAVS